MTINYTIYHKSLDSLSLTYKIGSGDYKTIVLNPITSSSYVLPEQLAAQTKVTYYFTGKSSKFKNGNAGVKVGNSSYTYTTPSS